MHMKSTGTAYLLWFFLGALGAHKFYLNKTGMGILYIFTLGLFNLEETLLITKLNQTQRLINLFLRESVLFRMDKAIEPKLKFI